MIIFLEDKVKTGAFMGMLLFNVGGTVFVIWRQFRRYKKRLAMTDHYVKIGEQQETKIMFKKWIKFYKFTSIKNLPEK